MNQSLQSALSDMQGQLFEMSVKQGLDSESFTKAFMQSEIAKELDLPFHHLQWAGKEYIMDRILDELKGKCRKGGIIYDAETMYWTGYVYRRWHFYTGETSKEIYRQAPAEMMRICYLPFHTESVEMAVDRLKEIYEKKNSLPF